jgi:hypothetical protein
MGLGHAISVASMLMVRYERIDRELTTHVMWPRRRVLAPAAKTSAAPAR